MTITAEDVTVSHDCNGSVTDFAFTFKIFAEGDIKVIATDSDGVETDLTITTDYTVAGENGLFESGGTVSTVKEVDGVMTSYAYASGYTITILLNLTFKQETDLIYGGSYSSQAIELMSDRLTKIIQQLAAKQTRAFRFKASSALGELELDDPTAGYYLYSPDGISVTWVTSVVTGATEATAFGKSLIVVDNAPAALTVLGLTAFIKTLIDDTNAYTARKTLLTPLSRVLTTAKTAAYTIQASDDGMLITVDATGGNIAITLPAVGDLWNGFCIGIKKIDSGSNYVESTPDGAEEIDGESSDFVRAQNDIAWYVVDGTGWKVAARFNSRFLNVNSLTNHGILLGSGTGVITPTAVMSNGQILVGQTGADPLPKTLSGLIASISAAGVVVMANDIVKMNNIQHGTITLAGHKAEQSQSALAATLEEPSAYINIPADATIIRMDFDLKEVTAFAYEGHAKFSVDGTDSDIATVAGDETWYSKSVTLDVSAKSGANEILVYTWSEHAADSTVHIRNIIIYWA